MHQYSLSRQVHTFQPLGVTCMLSSGFNSSANVEQCLKNLFILSQTRMQCLQPDPNAQYRSVYQALKRIIKTEGVFRPLRGLNITMMGAGPAHALYFACYERVKRSLSDVMQSGGNSHLANGTRPHVSTPHHLTVIFNGFPNKARRSKVRMCYFNAITCLHIEL